MLFGPICAWLMIMGGMFLLFARWVFTIRQRAKTASPPDSADRAGSRKPVSEKREYFKGRLETIGGFAPKLFKLGVYREGQLFYKRPQLAGTCPILWLTISS
jgi:hypothetical protein